MSSTNNYNTYRPTKLKVSRFGVNLSDTTNENLNLASSQYMIVGERQTNQGGVTCNVYSLQVDNEGIAVNMSLSDRETNKTDYPTQLSGSLYVDGNIILTGVITGETSSNILGGSSNFWKYSANDNIYYNGKVNIGDYGDTIDNTYSLNIVEPANKNINKSQVSIQNGQLSEFRTAILGDALNSPIIFNTRQQSPIEFHVGRDTEYFNTIYTSTYWNADEGASNTVQIDIPIYGNSSNNSPPNLVIDQDGNVGINTNTSKRYNYLQRKPNTENSNAIEYTSIYESMNMYVDGPLYARDVLMYDYETATAKSLDDIYTRRIGEFIEACNIIPGEFPEGIFIFNSNVSILTTDTSEALNIGGNINCEEDITATNITTTNSGTFNNNITVNNNVYLNGNLYKEIYNEDTGSNEYAIISFDNYSFSNIVAASNLYNLSGGGVATTGRLGVGVYAYGSGPDVDEVNHQHVVHKRNPGIYELELMDKSSLYIKKTAWIGHPQVGDRSNDASLIFITPKSTNPEYNLYYSSSPQNIYFFPGFEENSSVFSLTGNTPTLGIFEGGKVGIQTYTPEKELDVNGDIQFNGKLYYKYSDSFDPVALGIWRQRINSDVTEGSGTYSGIEYFDTSAPHVGINTNASDIYGLNVSGKIRSIDGYYTNDGYEMMPWYNTLLNDGVAIPNSKKMFTIGQVGIGMRRPETTLHIMDSSSTTHLKLSQSGFTHSTILQMQGNTNNYMFHMDDTLDMLELYNGESNVLYTSTANRPFIIRDLGSQNNQMIINSNTSLFNNTNDTLIVNGSVKVYGDMDITGTYKLSGNAITITNSQAEYDLELNNTQDILIAGTDIFINPNQQNNKRLYLGYTQEKYNNYVEGITTSALLNILRLRDIDEEYIANFTSEDNSVLVRLFSESRNKTVDIGMTSTNIFSIINPDRPTKPLLTFTDNSAYSRLGIGTTSTENTSMVNIFNSSSGTDIFRITRYTNTTSTGVANIAPNMTLHKKLSTTNYEWRFIGPEASYRQKLQFNYKDTSTPETEIYTFTSNGCFGIGNTQPTYAVDIRTSGTTGCIRMHQTDTNVAKPQLLFQSGANEYGVDTSTDFRMYSYSNNFYLDMQDILRGQQTLFHFTSNGSLGIHQNADSQYSVSIDGKLNVSDKIYINGSEVFTTTLGTDITLTGGNIILNPDTSSYNGLSINYNGGTSNLLYVKSGNDGNMLVLDSDYEEAQINFRVLDNTTTKRLHRIGASNQSLIIEYGSNDVYNNLTNTFNDNHDGYYRTAEISYDGTTFNTDINTNLNVTGSTSIIYENDTFDDPALYVDGIAKFTSNVYIENDLDVTNNLHVHGCYINDSDRRIKYDIQPLDNALDKIKKLSGYTFNKYNTNKRLTGLIAQEVNEVLPEAVFIDDTDILGIDYGSLMGLIIEGIKELSIQLDDIKKRLD